MEEGYRSGKLVAIVKIQKYKKFPHQSEKWLCKCDCGNEKITLSTSLYNKCVKSCGCHDFKNKKIHDKENYIELMKDKINKNIEIDENGCWLWMASRHKQGYGNLSYKRIPSLAHRVSWMVYNGEIPQGIKVCHKCDEPSCVNPDHLFLGTQLDNVGDCVKKGRFTRNIPKTRRIKLNWCQVQEIKELHKKGMTRNQLKLKFEVSQTCIAKILTGISWNTNWTKEL